MKKWFTIGSLLAVTPLAFVVSCGTISVKHKTVVEDKPLLSDRVRERAVNMDNSIRPLAALYEKLIFIPDYEIPNWKPLWYHLLKLNIQINANKYEFNVDLKDVDFQDEIIVRSKIFEEFKKFVLANPQLENDLNKFVVDETIGIYGDAKSWLDTLDNIPNQQLLNQSIELSFSKEVCAEIRRGTWSYTEVRRTLYEKTGYYAETYSSSEALSPTGNFVPWSVLIAPREIVLKLQKEDDTESVATLEFTSIPKPGSGFIHFVPIYDNLVIKAMELLNEK